MTIDLTVYIVTTPCGECQHAVVEKSSQTVHFSFDGYEFESEAYHLPAWCNAYKLNLRIENRTIEV